MATGLKGLLGLSGLSDAERRAWYDANPKYKMDVIAADRAYRNQQYIAKYGEENFERYNWSTRDAQWRAGVVDEAFIETYGNHAEKLGDSKYLYMDTDAKQRLLESGYMPSQELLDYLKTATTNKWEDYDATEFIGMAGATSAIGAGIGALGYGVGSVPGYAVGALIGGGVDLLKQTGERIWGSVAGRHYNADEKANIMAANLKILDDIYSESAARELASVDRTPYLQLLNEQYLGRDAELDDYFNATFDHFTKYSENKDNWDGELDDLTNGSNKASLLKEWLADYYALNDKYPPLNGLLHPIVELALNDKLQNYIADNQGWWKKNVFLPGRQVAVTMETKAFQISTGFENDFLQLLDNTPGLSEKFDVYMDIESGNIVPTAEVENGTIDPGTVQKVSLDRSLLHRMGVYTDGTQLGWAHNPRIISAMQTTNTFDPEAAVQYFETGYSPYVPTAHVGEDQSAVYATANMVGLFTFDAVMAWMTRGAARGLGATARTASNIGMYSTSIGGLGAIGEGYALGHMEEALLMNLLNVDNHFYEVAKQQVDAKLNGDRSEYTDAYYSRVGKRAQELLDASVVEIQNEGNYYKGPSITPEMANLQAEIQVLNELYQEEFNNIRLNDEKYQLALLKSVDAASETATMVRYAEMLKYGYHYLYGYRNYFVSDKTIRLERMMQQAQNSARFNRVNVNGRNRLEALNKPLELGVGKFSTTISGTPAYILRSAWGNVIVGGGLSNATDEMVTGAARNLSSAEVNAFLNNEYRGEAVEDGLTFLDSLDALTRGALNTVGTDRFNNAFVVGAIGSGAGFMPNLAAATSLLTKKGRETWRSFGKGWNSEKASFLINNGFLGGWAQERAQDRTVLNWALVVNTALDLNDDFGVILDALSTDHIGVTDGFSKETKQFLQAINSISLLENLLHSGELPNAAIMLAMGDEVTNVLEDNRKLANREYTLEDANRYLAAYYSNNTSKSRTEENDRAALAFMEERAQQFQLARESVEKAKELISQAVQQNGGKPISKYAIHKIVQRMALTEFAESRLGLIEELLTGSQEIGADNAIAVGNKDGAQHLIDFYNELANNVTARYQETRDALQEVDQEIAEYEARVKKMPVYRRGSKEVLREMKKLQDRRRSILNQGVTEQERDAVLNNVARRKPLAEEALRLLNEDEGRVLTADEILHLSPVLRDRMLNNPELYSQPQLVEIALANNNLATNPMAKTLVRQAAQYYNFILDSKAALGYINMDMQRAAEQLDAAAEVAMNEVPEIYLRRGVKSLTSLIDQIDRDPLLSSYEQKALVVLSLVDKAHPEILRRMDYPQYQLVIDDTLKKYDVQEMLNASIDSAMEIGYDESLNLEQSNPRKAEVRDIVRDIVRDARTHEEAINNLKSYLQANDKLDDDIYEAVDGTLQNLEQLISLRRASADKPALPGTPDVTSLDMQEEQQARQDAASKAADEASTDTAPKVAKDKNGEELQIGDKVSYEKQDGSYRHGVVTNLGDNGEVEVRWDDYDYTGSNGHHTLSPEYDLPYVSKGTLEKLDDTPADSTESSQTEGELIQTGAETVDLGLVSEVTTPTLEEEEAQLGEDKIQTTPVSLIDQEEAANRQSTSPTVMQGNPIFAYDLPTLKGTGKLEKRVPNEEGDLMDQFFKWLDNHGILLQEIIDNELGKIAKSNPDVHYLWTKPRGAEDRIQNLPFLVVEYTDKVRRVHNEDRGGVISSNGKQWLVIGTPWASRENLDAWNNQMTQMKTRRKSYLDLNPQESYYVDSLNSTKIADIAPGRRVRQLLNDEAVQIRTLSEILSDPMRNPFNLKLQDLGFGIQKGEEFKSTIVGEVLTPNDVEGNNGVVFLLMPTANGKYLPAKILPVMFSELKESELKAEIDKLLLELTSAKHSDRYAAILALKQRLVLDDANNIWIGTNEENVLKIKKDGEYRWTFDLNNSNLNPLDVLDAIKNLNPRIQVGLGVLTNPDTVEMYDKAGCLTTDVAKIGTSNASFSIYSLGPDGQPIILDVTLPSRTTDSEFSRNPQHFIPYQGVMYGETKGTYYDGAGNPVTDKRLITQLQYTLAIMSRRLLPVKSSGNYDYYIISSDKSNPIAVKMDRDSKYIEVASKEASQELIDMIAAEAALKEREEAAKKQQLEFGQNITQVGELDTVDLGLGEEMTPQQIEEQITTGFEVPIIDLTEGVAEEEKPQGEPKSDITDNGINNSGRSFAELHSNQQVFDIGLLFMHDEYGQILDDIINAKIESGEWENFPDATDEIEKYLQAKGIQTTGIGQNVSVEQWLDMVKNCK